MLLCSSRCRRSQFRSSALPLFKSLINLHLFMVPTAASGAVSNLLVEVSLERQIIEVIARAGPAGISGAQVGREGGLRAGERRVEGWRGMGAGSRG